MKKYLFLIILLSGCMTEKKAQRITNDYLTTHPSDLAKRCEESFPVKSIQYKSGTPGIILDSTWTLINPTELGWDKDPIHHPLEVGNEMDNNASSQFYPLGDTSIYDAYRTGYNMGLKQSRIERIIIRQVDTLIKRDSAGESVLQLKVIETQAVLDKATADYTASQETLKKVKHRNLIFILIIIGLGAFTIFKSQIITFLTGGWSKLVSKL